MNAAVATVPVSGLEWRQWARAMIEELDLSCGEANMLRLLADRATAGGGIELGVPLLARQLVLSESQVYRLLGALSGRGLLCTRQRGPGRIAYRRLLAVPEPIQLSLFDAPVDEQPSARASTVAEDAPASPVAPWPRIGASKPSHPCEPAVEGQFFKEEGARCARADSTEPVLEQHLDEVLAVLEAAPGLHVEPMAVNSALAAHPQSAGHDHLRAAHVVVSYAHEGGLHVTAANRLLLAELRKQTRGAGAGAPSGRWHAGRKRSAPPVSAAMVEQTDRETAAMARFMAAAGFGAGR